MQHTSKFMPAKSHQLATIVSSQNAEDSRTIAFRLPCSWNSINILLFVGSKSVVLVQFVGFCRNLGSLR